MARENRDRAIELLERESRSPVGGGPQAFVHKMALFLGYLGNEV